MPQTKWLIFHNNKNTISDDTITFLVHNVISLSKHVDDIVSDKRFIDNDNIGFTETQINPSILFAK